MYKLKKILSLEIILIHLVLICFSLLYLCSLFETKSSCAPQFYLLYRYFYN